MNHRDTILTGLLLVAAIAGTSGCSTTPDLRDGAARRHTAEALYQEAPWAGKRPTNIKAFADAAVETTQSLAAISADYSRQLELNSLSQQALLQNPQPSQDRSAELRKCLGVGGGIQGGLKCESIGHAAYKETYIDRPQTSPTEQLTSREEWRAKYQAGWVYAREPLITELEAVQLGIAFYGGMKGYQGFTNVIGP
jgi:hypothetical protein